MRAEKKFISQEYVNRLNQSAFFIVVDYRAVTVGHFTELRKRLRKVGAEVHVVKNSIFRIAAKETLADFGNTLAGQLAIVTGTKDISATAKVVKTFQSEFNKPQIQFGYIGNERLDAKTLLTLADLPSIEVLRSTLLGLIQAPASSLARVIKAHVDKQSEPAAPAEAQPAEVQPVA
ncbi:MAG: 50S ribosomal protein L10 [Verrucomicrobia bacterium]|nr:50S ribosomal protein L10 [Verrucomicrobiota bacterium]